MRKIGIASSEVDRSAQNAKNAGVALQLDQLAPSAAGPDGSRVWRRRGVGGHKLSKAETDTEYREGEGIDT